MGNQELQEVPSRRNDLEYIQDTYKVSDIIAQLHDMSKQIVKEEVNYKNINAACNCISKLNETINTAISAAKFLHEHE